MESLKEKLETFGDRKEYWSAYDTLADKYDKRMLQQLNQNIDILLIFVSIQIPRCV